MNVKMLIIALAFLVFFITSSGNAQLSNTECQQAQVWHLQQAMKWSHHDAQGFHLGASQAAKELGNMNGNHCQDWRQDASPPYIDNTGKVSQNA